MEKFGTRWSLVTPEGNAFFLLGVYNITGDDHADEQGGSYNARFQAKYGSAAAGWPQANRRLLSWGFNTIGPFSYRMTLPTDSDPAWPRGQQPVKMPFVGLGPNPSVSGRASGENKNLYAGLDPTVRLYADSRGGNFPDVFDPGWSAYVQRAYAKDGNLALYKNSPYFIGYFSDDTDFLAGFGSGVDFSTDPAGKYHWHLAFLALVTRPTQETNLYSSPANQSYSDATVYTKLALRDFLAARYGTIAALNKAWNSQYTNFDSDGGWPAGRGLLDENGNPSHHWLGVAADPYFLTGMTVQAKADLDDFLYEIAKKFFSVNRAAFKAVAPKSLFLGPTNLGGAGWRSPARGPILKAAGQFLDIVNVSTDFSQAQLDFITQWTGDVPLAVWEGITANGDSDLWRSSGERGTSWNLPTQAERGQKYRRDVKTLFQTVARPTGSQPFVGLTWWAWLDSPGEQRNWGLVSLSDNAYDGKEAIRASGKDPWGFRTGGEARDYGNFIGVARAVNLEIQQALSTEINSKKVH